MATAIQTVPDLLTLEEYLNTSYRPDCDFVDGVIEERNLGTPKHALLQLEIGHWFISHRKEWRVRVMGDVRTRTSPTRVRLPDVAIYGATTVVEEKAMTTPPLIAIEILSPEDRLNRVIVRLREFLAMGTTHVWLLDPIERVAYTCTSTGLDLVETPLLTVPNSPIYIDLPEIFAALD